MQEIKLKDAETGEFYTFFGRRLAEAEILLKRPTRNGMAYFHKTDADRQGPTERPLYVIATESDGGAFEIEKLRDFHRVQRFLEMVIRDGFQDPLNAHPLFGQLWTFLGDAAANDIDLFEPLERLKEFRNNLKRERAEQAAAPPVVPREVPALGFFDEKNRYENPTDSLPTV
jgi:hypothetical protein